ncbi:hypothetical protein Ccrd_000600 [Cynara cardunculus var. scolymus]|uniref:Uncharacterized protein n=1 Tax=Cynara cardunculus var. scolymus TaxID=59895 RepID=A0A103XUT4_CYNCS|nr:hypothetical protein Ccrd_000600 [Cynara cardunculus var. scolymus]
MGVVVVVDDPIDDGTKMVDVARDGDGAFLFEPIFIFCVLQKLHEKGMIKANNRHHKALLFGAGFTNFDGQTAFGNPS